MFPGLLFLSIDLFDDARASTGYERLTEVRTVA